MSDLHFNVPTIAKTAAILLGLSASSFGVAFILSPIAAAQSFGLPQNGSQMQDPTFLRVLGGRNLAIGLAGLSLAYHNDFLGVGVVLLCLVIPGTLDSVFIFKKGVRSAAYSHMAGTVVFLILGFYFVWGGWI